MSRKKSKPSVEAQPEPALPEGVILAVVVRGGGGYVVGDEIGVTEEQFRKLGKAVVRVGEEVAAFQAAAEAALQEAPELDEEDAEPEAPAEAEE